MTLIKLTSRPSIINEIDHLFHSYKSNFLTSFNNHIWSPKFEILNIDESYIVRADLPGLIKKDVNIEISEDIVTVSGERKNKHNKGDSDLNFSELSYGSFSKSFSLPKDSIKEKIDAKMKDGVLTIEVPRLEPSKPKVKKISIK